MFHVESPRLDPTLFIRVSIWHSDVMHGMRIRHDMGVDCRLTWTRPRETNQQLRFNNNRRKKVNIWMNEFSDIYLFFHTLHSAS